MRTRRESLTSWDQGFRDPNPVSCLGAKIEDMGAPLHWADVLSVSVPGNELMVCSGDMYIIVYIWYIMIRRYSVHENTKAFVPHSGSI